MLNKIENELEEVTFATIDVNDNKYLAQNFGVSRVPDLLLLKDGAIFKHINTVISQDQLLNEIKKTIA